MTHFLQCCQFCARLLWGEGGRENIFPTIRPIGPAHCSKYTTWPKICGHPFKWVDLAVSATPEHTAIQKERDLLLPANRVFEISYFHPFCAMLMGVLGDSGVSLWSTIAILTSLFQGYWCCRYPIHSIVKSNVVMAISFLCTPSCTRQWEFIDTVTDTLAHDQIYALAFPSSSTLTWLVGDLSGYGQSVTAVT